MLSCVWLFATPWTVVRQAPLSMKFSRQECWSGLPFPTPTLVSLAFAGGFFTAEPPKKILEHLNVILLGNEIINGCKMFHWVVPDLKDFSTLWMVREGHTLSRNPTSEFECWCSPDRLSSAVCDAGQWQAATGPRQPCHQKCAQLTRNLSEPILPFCFSLSLRHSINYMRSSTPYYKMRFVLDFVQLQV